MKMINHQPQAISYADADSNTPLHYACKFGKREVAATLIKEHANVNAV